MCIVDLEKLPKIFSLLHGPLSQASWQNTISSTGPDVLGLCTSPQNITNITRWAESLPDLWTFQAKPLTNLLMPSYPGSSKGCLLLLLGRYSSSCTPQLVQDSEIPGRIPEKIPVSMPRPRVPEARQSAGCFSSRSAIMMPSPHGPCELSALTCTQGSGGFVLRSHVLWESWKRCFLDLWDHPLLREERGKLSACTWSSQIVTEGLQMSWGRGLLFWTIVIWFLHQHSSLVSPCSAACENALQGWLRPDATFISSLLFERSGLCRITFHRITESRQTTATGFPSCTKQVTLSWKEFRLVKQGPCWLDLINLLFCSCSVMVLKMICLWPSLTPRLAARPVAALQFLTMVTLLN